MIEPAQTQSLRDFQRIDLSELVCITGDNENWLQKLGHALNNRLQSIRELFAAESSSEPIIWVFPEKSET